MFGQSRANRAGFLNPFLSKISEQLRRLKSGSNPPANEQVNNEEKLLKMFQQRPKRMTVLTGGGKMASPPRLIKKETKVGGRRSRGRSMIVNQRTLMSQISNNDNDP